MDFIVENQVGLLIAAEALAWISILAALLFRYWFRLHKVSLIAFVIFLLNDLWILTIGVVDYLNSGAFSVFQFVVVAVILYGVTFGKQDFLRLDRALHRQVAKWSNEPVPVFDDELERSRYGAEHARRQRIEFFKHLVLYAIVHLVFWLTLGLEHEVVDKIHKVWTVVLIVDGAISLSYTLWPKKEKQARDSM